MSKPGKRFREAAATVDREKLYTLEEAVKLVKGGAKAKFDETIEVAMNLGVDPRHADQMVRGVCQLPHGSGRKLRVAVFAKGAKAEEAKKAGADVVGAEDLVEQVQKGVIDFDRCIATPDMMPLVGRLGKVLGPRGLMPNPKVGTVTADIAAGRARGERRRGRVPRREGGPHPCRRRQSEFQRAGAGREYPRLRRCGDEGEALGRQGHVLEAGRGDFDHGARREDRAREPLRRRRGLVDEFRGRAIGPEGSLALRRRSEPVRDCRCGRPLKPFGPA